MKNITRRVLLCGFAVSLGAQTAAAADEKVITLGISAPLQIQSGRDALDGAQLAISEINAKGGVLGRKLSIVSADEGADTQQGVAAIRKIIDQRVDAIVGAGHSGVALAQISHVANSKTLFLGITAAATALTDFVARDRERFKYFFRVSPVNARRQAASYVDFGVNMIKGELGYQKIAIVGQNAKFIQDLMPMLKEGLTNGGVTVTMTELFEAMTSDFSPILSRVKDSGAQFMMIFMNDANSDVFVKQWYDVKLPIPIGGLNVKSQDTDFFARIGGKSVSEIVAKQFADVPITPKTLPFWNRFKEVYKREPVYTAAGAYDAVYLYADAVTRANTVETNAVITALEGAKFTGAGGRISFDELHDVKDGDDGLVQVFSQWQADGSRTLVWPKSLANGKAILPPWMAFK